jgi:hypothetical protein
MENERTINEICKDFVRAFEDVGDSIAKGIEAFHSLMDSTMKNHVAEAFLNELKWLEKLGRSNWFARWYYKMKYRKAKYSRIKIERFYNQNFK